MCIRDRWTTFEIFILTLIFSLPLGLIFAFGLLSRFKPVTYTHLSLEERTVPEYWWSDNPEIDPWMWRAIIACLLYTSYL